MESVIITRITRSVTMLEKGKASGKDGLAAEHLIYASPILYILLSLCFSSFFIHGYLPETFMYATICPIVKDKSKDITSADNYRPIAIVTALSKTLELCILHRIYSFIETSALQFGFKSKHSTDMCIFVLKEIIDFYKRQNSPVFLCFMDATKAFDRVNHWTLFRKLINRNIPLFIIRILQYWYSKQLFFVHWASADSNPFQVSNGVRQGSVLSPKLFAIYVDELSSKLQCAGVGCYLANCIMNHLFYADDLALICPSVKALRKLIDICEHYGTEHDILYHTDKTECMAIFPKSWKQDRIPNVYLYGKSLKFVSSKKYLGYIMSSTGMDDADIQRQLRSFYARANFIVRNFGQCSQKVKCVLFKSFLYSVYCLNVWCNFSAKQMSKLRIAYNNAMRLIFDLKRDVSISHNFVTKNIFNFASLHRRLLFAFCNRLSVSDNPVIRTCVQSDSYFHSAFWKYCREVLY